MRSILLIPSLLVASLMMAGMEHGVVGLVLHYVFSSKLAAGTERGDIIVYLLEGKPVEKSLVNPPHVNPPHILNCSRSEVTCLSWSGDDR